MSALHLAAMLCVIFVLLLLASGYLMNMTISAQVRAEVDAGLIELSGVDAAAFTTADQVIDLISGGDEMVWLTNGFRAPDGTLYGQMRPEIFDHEGFATMSASTTFNDAGLAALRREWRIAGEPDQQATDTLWRVYVVPLAGGRMAYLNEIDDIEGVLALIPGVVAWIGIPAIFVSLLAGLTLGWRQQRRLDRISYGIGRIADGEFSHRIGPARSRDDLDEVMADVDAAAGRLERSFNQLILFTQNIAHELRTPLARLRAGIDDVPESPATSVVIDRVDEVIRVFDAVQRIARLSNRDGFANAGFVDLGQVARLIHEIFVEIAEENGQLLQLKLSDPAIVRGDHQLVAQLVSNLIDNAIRYSGTGSTITLVVTGRALTVADTGPGVTEQQRSRIFVPFDQLGETPARGMGIGLALVRAIADYHGATLSVGNTDMGGLQISAEFRDIQ